MIFNRLFSVDIGTYEAEVCCHGRSYDFYAMNAYDAYLYSLECASKLNMTVIQLYEKIEGDIKFCGAFGEILSKDEILKDKSFIFNHE